MRQVNRLEVNKDEFIVLIGLSFWRVGESVTSFIPRTKLYGGNLRMVVLIEKETEIIKPFRRT